MSYSIDDLKKVLQEINGDLWDITYTEHFLEKSDHRLIDVDLIDKKILEDTPIDIGKLSYKNTYFTLTYESGDGNYIHVIVSIFNLKSLIMISVVCGD